MTTKRTYREVPQDFQSLDAEHPEIEGCLVKKTTQSFPNGVVGRYSVETGEGKTITFLGSTIIDDLLENVPEGTFIRVEYAGEIKTGQGRKLKQIKLFVAE